MNKKIRELAIALRAKYLEQGQIVRGIGLHVEVQRLCAELGIKVEVPDPTREVLNGTEMFKLFIRLAESKYLEIVVIAEGYKASSVSVCVKEYY